MEEMNCSQTWEASGPIEQFLRERGGRVATSDGGAAGDRDREGGGREEIEERRLLRTREERRINLVTIGR